METLTEKQREEVRASIRATERTVNPFVAYEKFDLWELTKFIVLLPLFPIRFVLGLLSFVALAGFCELSTVGGFDKTKPMGLMRRIIRSPMQLGCRIFMFFFGYYWIIVKGKKAKRKEAPIFVLASHSTLLDSFLLGWILGPTSGMAKESVGRSPLIGSVSRANQMVFVAREDKDGRRKALEEFVRRAQSQENWGQAFVYPEGTCTNGKAIVAFKKGAFVPGVPVQPVLVKWTYKHCDPSWTASQPGVARLVVRLMSQLYNTCEVEYMPVYVPSEEEQADAEVFAANVQKAMAQRAGLPATRHSYEDSFLAVTAQKIGANISKLLDFEMMSLQQRVPEITLPFSKKILRRFARSRQAASTGEMDVAQFVQVFGVPLCKPMQELFALFDVDFDGKVRFSDVLIGFCFLTRFNTGIEEIIDFLVSGSEDALTFSGLETLLKRVFHTESTHEMAQSLFKAVRIDKGRTYTREQCKAFLEENPDVLVVASAVLGAFKRGGQVPLAVLSDVSELQILIPSDAPEDQPHRPSL